MADIDLPSDREVDEAIPEHEPQSRTGHALSRVAIPLVLVVLGVVALILGWTLLAIVLLLAAAIGAVADRLIRLGIVSQGDRDRERADRRQMRRTGRWPR